MCQCNGVEMGSMSNSVMMGYYPVIYRYTSNIADMQAEAEELANRIEQCYQQWTDAGPSLSTEVHLPFWSEQRQAYQQLLTGLK